MHEINSEQTQQANL